MVANGSKSVRIIHANPRRCQRPVAGASRENGRRSAAARTGRRQMAFKTLLAAGALAGGAVFAQPASRRRTSRSNSSSGTTRSTRSRTMLKKFEAENPGIKVNITDYTWPDYHDCHGAALPRRHADRRGLCRAGLAAGLGGRGLPRAARRRRAGRNARPTSRPTWPASRSSDMTYNGKLYGLPYYADTISFIYNKKILEDAGIAVPTTWEEVTRGGREAEGRRHGASDRLRVRPGASELLRRLRRAGLRARRRPLRRRAARPPSTIRTTPPTSSSNGSPTPSRRISCSRRRTNRRSSRR